MFSFILNDDEPENYEILLIIFTECTGISLLRLILEFFAKLKLNKYRIDVKVMLKLSTKIYKATEIIFNDLTGSKLCFKVFDACLIIPSHLKKSFSC